MDPNVLIAAIAAIGSTIGLAISSLRKRKDADIQEMEKRIASQSARIELLEAELAEEREKRIQLEKIVYSQRALLAKHGIEETVTR